MGTRYLKYQENYELDVLAANVEGYSILQNIQNHN